jgi:RHH-type rel operon transcriptional repressor/antitoxin RelB
VFLASKAPTSGLVEVTFYLTHLREMIEELEDYFLAAKVLERVRNGKEQIHSSAQVRADLGMDDTPEEKFG